MVNGRRAGRPDGRADRTTKVTLTVLLSVDVQPLVVLTVFPVIFIGELPDKTMFASLVLATRGRAGNVWLGAAAGFLVQVVIALTIGVALFHLVPHRLLEVVVVAVMFGLGAVFAWRTATPTRKT
jgi:Ca2+/H+ antiporter, TMEM165/GDT1 family